MSMVQRFLLALLGYVAVVATAAALRPLLANDDVLWPAVLGAAAVTGTVTVARGWLGPSLASALGILAGVVAIQLVAGGGPTEPTAWLAALRDGVADVDMYPAPVPTTAGVTTLVTAIVTLAALLVAVCTASATTAHLAGIPLACLFIVATVGSGPSTLIPAFPVAGGCYLALLAAARWRAPARFPTPGPILAAVAAILAAAAALAAPGDPGRGWLQGIDVDNIVAPKGRDYTAIHPMTQLVGELTRDTPVEMMRVTTDDTAPQFLRVASLDTYTAAGWTQSGLRASAKDRVGDGMQPRYLDREATQPTTAQIDITGFSASPYLPVPANPTRVEVAGDWRWDADADTIFSARDNTGSLSYTVEAARRSNAQPTQLVTDDDMDPFLQLGQARSPAADAIAADALATATATASNPYQLVMNLREHFSPANGFEYTLRTRSGDAPDDLTNFLTNKQGFCEQYASAFAYLLRAAGIPARVVVGFTLPATGPLMQHSVMSTNAHAWVEVPFEGLGWVPFDATPAGGNQIALPPTAATSAAPSPVPSASSSPSTSPSPQSTSAKAVAKGATEDESSWVPWISTGAGLALLTAATPAIRRTRRRRRRLSDTNDPANSAWAEVCDTARELRIPITAMSSPAQVSTVLAGELSDSGTAAAGALRQAVEHRRYARDHHSDTASTAHAQQIINELTRRASRARRWSARLLPRR